MDYKDYKEELQNLVKIPNNELKYCIEAPNLILWNADVSEKQWLWYFWIYYLSWWIQS